MVLAEGGDVGVAALGGQAGGGGGVDRRRPGARGREFIGLGLVGERQDFAVGVGEGEQRSVGAEEGRRLDRGSSGGRGAERRDPCRGGVAVLEEGDDLAM